MKSMYDNFTPDEIQELKDQYVGNECDSDEYRETQPVKGLWQICSVDLLPKQVEDIINKQVDYIDNIDDLEHLMIDISRASQEPIVLELLDWLSKANFESYDGADELSSILEKVFDCYVEQGEHPYGYTEEECREWLNL